MSTDPRYALTDPDTITADYALGFLHELARQRAGQDAALAAQVEDGYVALHGELKALRAIRDRAAEIADLERGAISKLAHRILNGG